MQTFTNHIQTMIEDKNHGNSSDLQIAKIPLAVEITIAVLLISPALTWLNRTITRPLQQLLTQFEYITNGDLTRHVYLAGKNEIIKLFEFFGKIQQSLIRTGKFSKIT